MGGGEMSHPINDGGHAFPTLFIEPDYGSGYRGMSLRDYFAAAALPQVDQRSHGTLDEIALECYQIADAMLAAREVKP